MKTSDDGKTVENIIEARLQSAIQVPYGGVLMSNGTVQAPFDKHLSLASDLYNALCSIDQAVIALDCGLCIRFFAPAARQVFNVLPGDIGRPLSDLRALVEDNELFPDAANVLVCGLSSERNVSASDGRWFCRRLIPDRNDKQDIVGLTLIYTEITKELRLSMSLEHISSSLDNANIVHSNTLLAISHDLRQPLQSLTLLREVLRNKLSGTAEEVKLFSRFDCSIDAMIVLLNRIHYPDSSIVVHDGADHGDAEVEVATVLRDAAPSEIQKMLRYHRLGMVLLVEEDTELRNSLADALKDRGFYVTAVENAVSALELADYGAIQPDAVLSDYNLLGNLDGIALGQAIRTRLRREIPLIICTGDVSEAASEVLTAADCLRLTKPVGIEDLAECLTVAMMDGQQAELIPPAAHHSATQICIVDDEGHARSLIVATLEDEGYSVVTFSDAEDYLAAHLDPASLCLLLDLRLPGIGGIELLARMQAEDILPPTIILTAVNDPQQAVCALKAGAIDFLLKPVSRRALLDSVEQGVERVAAGGNSGALRRRAKQLIGQLTERQLMVMSLILAGHPNKIIAADLGVSQRTVENHRAAIMHRTGTRSLPELARLSVAAGFAETF